MSAACYLFLQRNTLSDTKDSEFASVSWVEDDSVNNPKLFQGSLSDLANTANLYPVVVVLPGERITCLTASIPGSNRQRVRQALPYALEDYVIDDVEQLHFSIADEAINGKYRVAVVDKQYFQFVISKLKLNNINPVAITADYMLLEEDNVLFVSEQRVLFNSSEVKFATSKNSFIEQQKNLLPLNLELHLIRTQKDSTETSTENERYINVITKNEQCVGNELACLIKYRSKQINIINLLQGQFKKKRNWSMTREKWLPIAALFLFWITIKGSMFLFEYISLSKQNEKLNNEIVKIYKNTFPDSKKIIDAQAQMKQKLDSLKQRKGQQGRSFAEMLAGSADVMNKVKGLRIKSLRYFDGRINLELQLSNLQDLDKLKKQFVDEKGYQVEIQNASSEKDFVTARLQITGVAI